MSLSLVRFRTYSGTAAEVRSQRARVFAALHAVSPQGVVCTPYSHESGQDFILALEREEAAENPLVGLPQAARLQDLTSRAGGAPVLPEPSPTVGSCNS